MIKISDAELEVMKVIWNRGEVNSMQIIRDLEEFKWDEATIRTMIRRLCEKRAVQVTKIDKNVRFYAPIIREDEYKEDIAVQVLKKLYDNSLNQFVLSYCEIEDISLQELKEIEGYIKLLIEKIEKK